MLLLNLNERGKYYKSATDSPTPENQSSIPTIETVLCPIIAYRNRHFKCFSLQLEFYY